LLILVDISAHFVTNEYHAFHNIFVFVTGMEKTLAFEEN